MLDVLKYIFSDYKVYVGVTFWLLMLVALAAAAVDCLAPDRSKK